MAHAVWYVLELQVLMLAGLKMWAEAAEQQQQQQQQGQGGEASGGGAAGAAPGDSSALSPTDLLPLVRLFQEYPLSKHAQSVLLGVSTSTSPGRGWREGRERARPGQLARRIFEGSPCRARPPCPEGGQTRTHVRHVSPFLPWVPSRFGRIGNPPTPPRTATATLPTRLS